MISTIPIVVLSQRQKLPNVIVLNSSLNSSAYFNTMPVCEISNLLDIPRSA